MTDSWGIYNPKTLYYFVGKFDENISYTILILMEM
jgi:hypothetical protein